MGTELFLKVLAALVLIAVLYGIATTIIVLSIDDPSDTIVSRTITGFGAIFSGLVGFCGGYLAGRSGNGDSKP